YDVLDGTVRQTQLFHLGENPHEFLTQHADSALAPQLNYSLAQTQRNLADDPSYAAKRAELEALLLSEMRRLHDPYRLWDQPDDGLPPMTQPEQKPKRKQRNKDGK
ncbi:MAG: hypothetical protein KDA62_18635, partial [Planctomycetales bacterium]|nr:hypothetical protein [Planctomycetales bacterium]